MASLIHNGSTRLFGMELSALVEYFRLGIAEALRWRALRWLTPEYPVLVLRADGGKAFSLGASATSVPAPKTIRHVAVELPEESVLRRSLSLPALGDDDIRQAAKLDALSASPFAEPDLAWTFAVERSDPERVRVDIAMTSRPLIEREIAAKANLLGATTPEVWTVGAPPLVFPGYGESARLARSRRDRMWIIALLGLALLQLAALLVMPALQQRQIALDAIEREQVLKGQVKTQLARRDELAKLAEQGRLLNSARGGQRDYLALLNDVTRVLPDDSSLGRLEVNGSSVRMFGQSDNTAKLLEVLGANPAFRDVRAPGGITRAASAGAKENFTIEFAVDAPSAKAP